MNRTIYKAGYWSALLAFVATLAFDIAQLLQLVGVLNFPTDQVLIFGFSLCIVIPFLLAMLALHYATATDKKFWSHAALLFTTMYVVFVTANYVVQLATVIPMTLNGSGEQIHILNQTPHSLFWDFDAIGYICMGLATLFAAPVFKRTGFEKWVRYGFITHALVTPLIAFVYFYPNFSDRLLLIAIPWSITAPLIMLLLAIMFRKELRSNQNGESFNQHEKSKQLNMIV